MKDQIGDWPKDKAALIPDKVIVSENARRNARKRTTYTGGLLWKKHNPDTTRCRCKDCSASRVRPPVDGRSG